MSETLITLVSKPGCHLCELARLVIDAVVQGLDTESPGLKISLEELSILEEPQLLARYAFEIPVVLVNGRMHTILRVDPDRLRATLLEV